MKLDSFIQDVNSWDDFKRKLKDQPKHIKGALFEQWTRCFLQYYPIYREKLKNVWLLKDVPSAVRFKLNIPSSDQGIDLIAETREGSYWAIQCKFLQDESNKLSHRALSTFISLSTGIANNISLCLVCTTADDIPPIYKGKKNIAFVSSDEWNKLDADYFAWLKSGYQYPPPKPIPFKPRAHQIKAIAEAKDHFITREERRGKLIFPCGSGKSLVGYWINKEFKSSSVIVALPSLALVKQTLEIYLREAVANSEELYFLCVCSDQGIGRSDDVLTHTKDLGVECVTDPDKIGSWLLKNKSKKTIIFTTYQSGRAVSDACDQIDHVFDLGIFDEAHKTVGDKDGLFSHLLSDENIRIHKRVFMTATERRYQGTSDTILSMDNHNVYGETFSLLSFKQAIELELLSDYKIITLVISNEEVKDLVRRNAFVKPKAKGWDEVTEARTIAAMIALRKAMTENPIHHALTFHSSIQKAESFKENQFVINSLEREYTPVEPYHVSGAMPTGERSRIINDFKNSQKGIITNARCLTEGVDVPQIDCVLFADPRKSTVDIVQAAGRALRKHPGKEFGYIILPVFTNSNKTEEIIQSQEFSDILIVLTALAANDERIIEYFRSKNNVGANKEQSHQLLTTNSEKLTALIDPELLHEEIELAIWNKLAKLSWRPFEEAREFIHTLNLKSIDEWKEYLKSREKPSDIPSDPYAVYSTKGWVTWGDWLGTYTIASYKKVYRPFDQARAYVRSLGLSGWEDWRQYLNSGDKPTDIPSAPHSTYKNQGWCGMGDWLGTKYFHYRNRSLLNYEEARQYVHALHLKSREEWNHFCKSGKKPDNIPHNPQNAYKENGWVGMSDWLGSDEISVKNKVWMSFEDARHLVRELKLEKVDDWYHFCKSGKKPRNIPNKPNVIYKKLGWSGYGDWLGTGAIARFNREYKPFEDARDFVHSLNLKSQQEWKTYSKTARPKDIPANPNQVYEGQGWISMGDWLGTGKIADQNINYLDFYTARDFVHGLGLKSGKEWKLYCKSKNKHPLIPLNAQRRYQGQGWISMGDWLGTGSVANYNKIYREFNAAREFVRVLNLSGQKAWRTYCKSGDKPGDIPQSPHNTYKNIGWVSYGDWLGNGKVATREIIMLPFSDARRFVQKLNLKNQMEWNSYCKSGKKPVNIPSNPQKAYSNEGWISLGDWLGTGAVAAQLIKYMTFKDAKLVVQKLGLQSAKEWKQRCKDNLIPSGIPKTPYIVYKDQWKGWSDFLGTKPST